MYLDETVWLALACEGELRVAVRHRLRRLIEEGWIPVTSTFALDRLVSLEEEPARLAEFLAVARRLASEIIPMKAEDLDSGAREVLVRKITLAQGIHISMARRCRVEGICTMTAMEIPAGMVRVSPI